MREAAAGRALRGRGALPEPPLRDREPRRAAGRGPARRPARSTCSGSRPTGDRAAVQVFPLRGGKMIDRHGFHLENVEGQDVTTILEAFCLEYYGNAPAHPAADRRAAGGAATSTALERVPLASCAAPRVEVRAPARGEKRRLAELAAQNARARARVGGGRQSEQKRLRRVEALEELREALNLESLPLRIECFDISNIQGQEIVGSMVVFQDGIAEEGALPQVRRARASTARTTSPRWRRSSRAASRGCGSGGEAEHDEGFATRAEPRRDRRRQGPALRRARGDAGLRPAARRRDRAREAGGGGLRAGPVRADPARPAQRRPAAAAADSRRGAPLRARLPPPAPRGAGARVDLRHAARASARRAAARSCGTSARPRACWRRARRSSRASPGCPPKTARAIYAQLHRTGRA